MTLSDPLLTIVPDRAIGASRPLNRRSNLKLHPATRPEASRPPRESTLLRHGVPVMAWEVPPALESFPELTLPSAEPIEITALDDLIGIQQFMQEQHSMAALGRRLQAVPAQSLAYVTFCINFADFLPPLAHSP